MFLISDLCTILESYLDKADIEFVYQAYLFGAEAHDGQTRKSGEPYIYHPIAVARILAELRMDSKTLAAAILHDVIEDTHTAKEQIASEFGDEVADIVDGLTKLEHISFNSKAEAKAESFRKLILSMVKDIRVILIKLADRLHNMRTLGVMSAEKARRIASETLDVYTPIANRLGMHDIRHELEDLAFKSFSPMRYRVLKESVEKIRGNRREIVKKIRKNIQQRLLDEGIQCKVLGREKHLYSIYSKMRKKQLPFYEVFDVYAFRIIVDTVDTCYRSLGVVHNLYKPVPGKFKDYVAIPKTNGYQSLHSILFSPYGVSIEVQIRTGDMHRVAEQGIASHWSYKVDHDSNSKKGKLSSQTRTSKWLKNLLEIQKNTGDSIEFLENVKIDLFPDEVYVFTPKGRIMELPRGATAIDFAYAVHTGVGDSCTSVKIDHKLMPLDTVLHNGQTIEVFTSKNSQPNPLWLNFVITAKARGNIRNALKDLQKDEAIVLGERLLNKCLSRVKLSILEVDSDTLNSLLNEFELQTLDDLLYDLGMGNRFPQLIARRLIPQKIIAEHEVCFNQDHEQQTGKKLAIVGTEGTVISYGKCCYPIPGDNIIAFVSTGRGLVVHKVGCTNVAEYLKKPEKWIEVQWSSQVEGDFSVSIRVFAVHKKGVLAKVASIISANGANIEQVATTQKESGYSTLDFILSIKNRKHLADLMRKLRLNDFIAKIIRQ